MRRPALGLVILGTKFPALQALVLGLAFLFIPALAPSPAADIPQIELFNEFMQKFINRVQTPVALAPALAVETKDDIDRFCRP